MHDGNLAQVPGEPKVNVIFHDVKLEAHLPRPGGMFLSGRLLVASGKFGNFEASQWEKIRESASDRDLK